ncbi:DsbA family protein [Paracoccus sp. SCSIO 75233]|uniref:DsbA family protein n=1 Tax=Paracoccus sp. SCSIO 75233 TaxID=3017782 RepID=UPI0022F12FD7|nr:DsbA family protein [Paracoccus sp. SCSIO 75233]WBU54393.1 DsbA family protein [Paracoccus sp. SCSIO 75233]
MKKLLAALLLSASPAAALDLAAMNDGEKAAFGEAVREYLMENPEVLIDAMGALEERRMAEEATNDAALIAQYSDEIFNDGYSWVGGNPDGDVTLVEFIDFRCGVCRQAFPHVEETLASDGNIRLILKDFPILGPESELASRFAIAAKQIEGDDAYKQVHDNFYTMRGNVTPDWLRSTAEEMGFDADAIMEAMNSDEVSEVIRKNAELAQTLGIGGTPSFILGDTLLRGMPRTGLPPAIRDVREKAAAEG